MPSHSYQLYYLVMKLLLLLDSSKVGNSDGKEAEHAVQVVLAEEALDMGDWSVSPAWLWSCTRWCCSPPIRQVPSTSAPSSQNPPQLLWNACPPVPTHTPPPCVVCPAWWQGVSDHIHAGPQHWPICDPTESDLWPGGCLDPPLPGCACLGMVHAQSKDATARFGILFGVKRELVKCKYFFLNYIYMFVFVYP